MLPAGNKSNLPVATKKIDDPYVRKHEILKDKYRRFFNSNDRLRNRIYHIKKEIKNLKRLKRVLVQRLLGYGDRFMDVCLEIPDSEPGASVEDKIIDQVVSVPSPSLSRSTSIPTPTPPARKRNRTNSFAPPSTPLPVRTDCEQNDNGMAELVQQAKDSVRDIIDSVITETMADRMAARAEQAQLNIKLNLPSVPVSTTSSAVSEESAPEDVIVSVFNN